MLRFIASRLLQGLLVLFALYTIIFFLAEAMPGDAFTGEKNISEETKFQKRERYGMNEPILVQYVTLPSRLFDLNNPLPATSKNKPVKDIIAQSYPASLVLGLSSLGFAICLGVPIGVVSAVRKNSWVDWGTMSVAMVGICIPAFTIGPLLQILIAANVPSLKIAGWGDPQDIILPMVTLGLVTAAYLARLTRGGMLEILSQDYIRTAKAKGVPASKIVTRHALRGGLLPAVAYIGPAFAALISGSFIVETIFQVPGMGQHFVNAVMFRDKFLLLGVALCFGVLIVIMNLAADLLTGILDPRVRLEGGAKK